MKRALLARDRQCRFPGCSHNRWLDAHHVMHWADGGETSLMNTMLLCDQHHRLLHEGGYSIQKDYKGDWYFRNSNGKVLADLGIAEPIARYTFHPEILDVIPQLATSCPESHKFTANFTTYQIR
jgi:hypothetical protein